MVKRYSPPNEQFFRGLSITDYYDTRKDGIRDEINMQQKDNLLNQGSESYAEYFAERESMAVPQIDFENIVISSYEAIVSAKNSKDNDIHFYDDELYTKAVIVFHIPYSGNIQVLKYKPASRIVSSNPSIRIVDNELHFEYIHWLGDQNRIKNEFESHKQWFKMQTKYLESDIERLTGELHAFTLKIIVERKTSCSHNKIFWNLLKCH